jgi:hypothetical protein
MALLSWDRRVVEKSRPPESAEEPSSALVDPDSTLGELELEIAAKANEILPPAPQTLWGRLLGIKKQSTITVEYVAENQHTNATSTVAQLRRINDGPIILRTVEWALDEDGPYEYTRRRHASITDAEVTYLPAPYLNPEDMLGAFADIKQTLKQFQPTEPLPPIEAQ